MLGMGLIVGLKLPLKCGRISTQKSARWREAVRAQRLCVLSIYWAITNIVSTMILAMSNTPPQTYPIAQYPDPPYRLHPLAKCARGGVPTRAVTSVAVLTRAMCAASQGRTGSADMSQVSMLA